MSFFQATAYHVLAVLGDFDNIELQEDAHASSQ